MINSNALNIKMLIHVAKHLGNLREKVVFVGGCTTGLLITDPAMPEVRGTQDVDVIVEVASRLEYYKLEKELRRLGFRQDMSENAPVCCWLIDDVKVDVMPTKEDILGFSNRWYLPAIRNAEPIEIEKELTIQLVTPPYFLATKIEAFKGRGHDDYMASHDIEDIITVLDGRPEIISEIMTSPDSLKNYLSESFRAFLANGEFRDAIPGHLLPDRASQARLPRLIKCLEQISTLQILRE